VRVARRCCLAQGARELLEVATVSQRQRRRSSPRTRRPVLGPVTDQPCPIWVDVSGRRMLVAGYTPGGAPYGIFEDEMDAGTEDLDMDNWNQPY
jgi:hypothetical protein